MRAGQAMTSALRPLMKKVGGTADAIGVTRDVGHPGQFGLCNLAVERRVELRLGITARAHQRGEAGIGGDLARALTGCAFEPAGRLRVGRVLQLGHPGVECGKNRLVIARERGGAAATGEQGRGHVDRVAHQIAIFE